jgi:putative flippase GtrA
MTTNSISKLFKYFCSRKFALFMAGGGVSYLLKASLSWLFSSKLILPFSLAYGITLSMVICYNFCYNVLVTFRVKGGLANRFLRYVSFVVIFNGTDYVLVNFFNRFAPWQYQVSIFLVTGVLMVVKFFVFNRWVFHEIKKSQEEM